MLELFSDPVKKLLVMTPLTFRAVVECSLSELTSVVLDAKN